MKKTKMTVGLSSILALVLVLAGCKGSVEDQSEAAISDPMPSSTEVPWQSHGNDWGEQRFSELKSINLDNVNELGLAWYFDMYTDRGVEATPLMVDGMLYVTSAWSMVYALDARTGELVWFYDPKVPREFLAKGCCDAVNRGVAYIDGQVIASTYDGRLVSLNAKTGAVQWDVQTTDREQSYTISGAPRIAGDKVIIGNGGAELGVRGYVTAYYVKDGTQAWRFYTVPGNPKDGFESKAMEIAAETWTGEWWKWGGGGTAWDSFVYDPMLNLVYLGVGNGSPWNQKLRSPGGGDNLFLASIVAVDADSGEYVWHYQTAPGDTWDYTATQHMILADLDWKGSLRKVIMQAPKNGFFYVLDRETGELLSAEPYSATTWATHVDMETGRPVETETARVFDGKNVTVPSNAGAHNWPAMSYNRETGLVYIPTLQLGIQFKEPTHARDMLPAQGYWNQGFDRTNYVVPQLPNIDEIIDSSVTGQLLAWDPILGQPRWTGNLGRVTGGGVLSTAGNLVFQGHHDQFRALNAETGELLWSDAVHTAAMAPPITYELDGEQYIAAAVGFGGGLGAEGGSAAHGWDISTNLSRVLVYKLGGDVVAPAPDTVKEPIPKPPPLTGTPDQIQLGQEIYQRHCSVCHGDGLRTGGLSPDLKRSKAGVHDIWQQIVRGGLLQSAGMVSFAQFVTEEEAEAVRQYVLSVTNIAYEQQQASADQP